MESTKIVSPASGRVATKKRLGADGEWVEEAAYFLDNKPVSEAEFRAVFPEREGVPFVPTSAAWPMRSDALGCHPKQVEDLEKRNRERGITGVTYDRNDGTAIIGSRAERKKLIAAEGFHDKNGGYGD